MWFIYILMWLFIIAAAICVVAFVVADILITAILILIFMMGTLVVWLCALIYGLIFGRKKGEGCEG